MRSNRRLGGPTLVGLAAFFWATDSLVRYPAISQIDPSFIVLFEHALAMLVFFPWIYWRMIRTRRLWTLYRMSPKAWALLAFIGVGGSAIGTVLFTASFKYVNPSVSVLLQKLQPVLVVLIATVFLGERPSRKFYLAGVVAVLAALVLSFPDLNFDPLVNDLDPRSRGVHYSLGAALLWAGATVAGKTLLREVEPRIATFWRFGFGLLGMVVLCALSGQMPAFHHLYVWPTMATLLYLAFIPGLIAMLIYYIGLAQTPATLSTIIELIYPACAVVLNSVFLHTSFLPLQWAAAAVLIAAVGVISF